MLDSYQLMWAESLKHDDHASYHKQCGQIGWLLTRLYFEPDPKQQAQLVRHAERIAENAVNARTRGGF
jgi:hypothetical protein